MHRKTHRSRRSDRVNLSSVRQAAVGGAVCFAVGALLLSACGTADVSTDTPTVAMGPRANEDHWHMAFGIFVCDRFLDNQPDGDFDALGIHTHIEDGLMHVHPFEDSVGGANATFQRFADQISLRIGNGSFTTSDGVTHHDGDQCSTQPSSGGKATVKLYVWPPGGDTHQPAVVTSDMGAQRLDQDGKAFVLALVPDGVDPPIPPNIAIVSHPSDNPAPVGYPVPTFGTP